MKRPSARAPRIPRGMTVAAFNAARLRRAVMRARLRRIRRDHLQDAAERERLKEIAKRRRRHRRATDPKLRLLEAMYSKRYRARKAS